jgi:hypothetical protein
MRPLLRTISLALLLALAAAACADGGEPPATGGSEPAPSTGDASASDALALLDRASRDLTKESFEATFSMTMDDGTTSMSIDGDMAFDPRTRLARSSMVMVDPSSGQTITMETITDGRDVYLRSDLMPIPGNRWLKIDASGFGAGEGLAGGASGAGDPASFVAFLQGIDDVEVVGTETVNGTETTHFRGTVDFDRLLDQVPAGQREELETGVDDIEHTFGATDMDLEAWVDAEGIPQRLVFGSGNPDGAGTFRMQMDIVAIGGEVDIEIPKKHEVTDFGSLQLPGA